MYELIITEKPNAGKRIALALATTDLKKENIKGVPYYKLKHKDKNIVIGCAVGHLFSLGEKKPTNNFPTFDIEWKPTYIINKGHFSKKYLDVLKKLSKDADEITIACDYDIEGEVIGLNVLRFICNRKDANRMKFSTLTKQDLIKSYENKANHIDWGQANAGETRHILDWYYGINISRALTSAISSQGRFKILSSGRVQGPCLKLVVDREREILNFKPKKYWQIFLNCKKNNRTITFSHKENKIFDKERALSIYNKIKDEKTSLIIDLEKKENKIKPPHPFDLTTLQVECYRCFNLTPKETLAIAQELYTNGFISYPRTSSQILPKEINYKKILSELSNNEEYKNLISKLPQKLKPNNGKKKDPAHPAIYPTGIIPKNLNEKEKKVYDIIVRRFIATFGEEAIRETITLIANVKGELFKASGTRTKKEGWFSLYLPYLDLKEEEIPEIDKGEKIPIKKIELSEKETQPPKRYTQATLIKELEKRNLGTKATRAQIIDTLYQRNYITGKSIKPTELGFKTIEILEKYCPDILDEKLTRHFEEEMEKIRENKKNKDLVLKEAREVITKIISKFKEKQSIIGKNLLEAQISEEKKQNTVGKCPSCSGTLVIKKGKYGKFIACSNYPKCKTTFKLPPKALIKVNGNTCKYCNYPMITIIRKGKKPQEICINPNCPSKCNENDKKIKENLGKPCPKCKQGKLVLKKSFYGSFLACSNYPKCKYIEKINP